jgi:hypothetical protein
MNSSLVEGGIRRWGFVAMWLLSAVSLKANPLADPVGLIPFHSLIPVILAILVEVMCVLWLLRRRRTPRLLILWLMGMHLLTYPLFLGFLWLAIFLHPALAMAIGEGLVVLMEGSLIYFLCRFRPSAKPELPLPSFFRSLLASLVGNICSAVAFPLLMMLVGWIAFSIASAVPD